MVERTPFQRTMRFQGAEYPKEADVRKAIELTVSQINSGTAGEKADAEFRAIITLYRRKSLPSPPSLAQRLTVPNAPELEFSTREHHAYLLDHYIELRFANVPIREMKVLMIDEWLLSLRGAKGRPLVGTTKASIRTLLSKCFKLAAKRKFISAFEHNPMQKRNSIFGCRDAEGKRLQQ